MVLLWCEFVGYLPSPYTVRWFDDVGNITSDDYVINTTRDGRNRSVLSGESEVGNSVISTLTITSPTDDDRGNYTCIMLENGLNKTVELVLEGMYIYYICDFER